MLTRLSVRDFIHIRSLDLEPGAGFTALTGETGAGKSAILGALSLALGGPARQERIRPGAESADVTAVFSVDADHPVRAVLAARGMVIAADAALEFRRCMKRGGGSRGFLNGQPAGASLMAEAGALLVEIHGQHAALGLLDAPRHRQVLDAYGGCEGAREAVAAAWARWREASAARAALEKEIARASDERGYLEHAVGELDALAPEMGESGRLALDRAAMQAGERVLESVSASADALAKAGVENALAAAARAVGRALGQPGLEGEGAGAEISHKLGAAAAALDRAIIEAAEARSALNAARHACSFSPDALEASEVRLFALRGAARKHNVDPDALPDLRARLRERLERITDSGRLLEAAVAAERAGEQAWRQAADRLSAARRKAAAKLTRAVMGELPALHLGRARFRANLAARAEPGPHGQEDVVFEIETVPGAGFGPLGAVASGGETARLALAISVCLADAASQRLGAATLVFDEADAGVGGAVAAAVGERLARLGGSRQVLAITHAPQVAAAAVRQLRVSRLGPDEGGACVEILRPKDRREEIARMLAGARVTKEARAAAGRLLAGA